MIQREKKLGKILVYILAFLTVLSPVVSVAPVYALSDFSETGSFLVLALDNFDEDADGIAVFFEESVDDIVLVKPSEQNSMIAEYPFDNFFNLNLSEDQLILDSVWNEGAMDVKSHSELDIDIQGVVKRYSLDVELLTKLNQVKLIRVVKSENGYKRIVRKGNDNLVYKSRLNYNSSFP